MKKPFSNEYVLKETIRHMENSVAISIKKTLARIKEFESEPELVKEALTALGNLDKLLSLLESIKQNNKTLLG